MGTVLLLTVLLTKFYMFIADAALANKEQFIPANSLLFGAPVWVAPMLVGLMISSGEIVWLFTMFASITLAMMVDADFNFVYMFLIYFYFHI
jgi:hypothetical protein